MRETSRSASTRWGVDSPAQARYLHIRGRYVARRHHQPADGRSGGERAHHLRRKHARGRCPERGNLHRECITADAFTAAASDASSYAADYDFLADAGTNSLEGFLFPKTYEIGDDATAESVVRMMLDQFKTETSGLDWSYPQSQGLTIYDAVKAGFHR
mgnify:CR=1 FL=1